MAQSVGNILVLFLRFQLNVILVTLGIEMFGNWSVGSFVFPLSNVFEVVFFVPWGVCDESIFVGEDDFLIVDINSVKS